MSYCIDRSSRCSKILLVVDKFSLHLLLQLEIVRQFQYRDGNSTCRMEHDLHSLLGAGCLGEFLCVRSEFLLSFSLKLYASMNSRNNLRYISAVSRSHSRTKLRRVGLAT
jgi:hypothetical protein